MNAKAHANNVRITPRKMRLVADLVRGKSVEGVLTTLKLARKRGIPIFRKLILSAKANALNNHNMDEKNLVIREVYVNEGATLKRIRPRARGRADRVMKRTSHATVILGER